MRFKELFEYVNFSPEAFVKRYKQDNGKKYPEIGENGENFTAWLEKYDPTQKKKYVNWMIARYLQGGIKRLEDIPSKVSGWLDTYDRLARTKKLKPEHKDIGRIKSDSQLADVIETYAEVETQSKSEAKSAEEQAMYDSDQAKLIYDDAEWKIVVPKTEEASCHFGKNTRWCTAAKKNNKFSFYNRHGPLYIILNKPTNKRWQFHFESDQFMNEKDADINIVSFLLREPILFNIFARLGRIEKGKNSIRIGRGWYNKKQQYHREDGPAIECSDGSKLWYVNGKWHREDGPAVERPNGTKRWYINGKLHREDGPAFEQADGTKEWYINDQPHREDGPAIEHPNGTKEWYLNGKRHREDGPAIEWADGTKEWYLNGKRHREDGPAIEHLRGTKEWYLNGKRHREDGPAIERSNGTKEWYLNGKRQRWTEA